MNNYRTVIFHYFKDRVKSSQVERIVMYLNLVKREYVRLKLKARDYKII